MNRFSIIALLAVNVVASVPVAFASGIGFSTSIRPTGSDEQCDKRLVGTWYNRTERESTGYVVERITVLKSDGSVIDRVRHATKDGRVVIVTSSGVWGTHNGLYVTMCKTLQFDHGDVHAGPTDCVAIYQIISTDTDEFRYKLYGEEEITIEKKVPDGYDFK